MYQEEIESEQIAFQMDQEEQDKQEAAEYFAQYQQLEKEEEII